MKRILSYFSIALCLILSQLPTMANSIDPKGDSLAFASMRQRMAEIRKVRPTVALVLSGGGAKGLYHIGVLRALEENDIPVAPSQKVSEVLMDCARASLDAEVFPVAKSFLIALGAMHRNDVFYGVLRSLEDEPDR